MPKRQLIPLLFAAGLAGCGNSSAPTVAAPAVTTSATIVSSAPNFSLEVLIIPPSEFTLGDPDARILKFIENFTAEGYTRGAPSIGKVRITYPFAISRLVDSGLVVDFLNSVPFQDAQGYVAIHEWSRIQIQDQVFMVQDPQLPVDTITYPGAVAFCRWISTATGLNVRLPTEAEWELAHQFDQSQGSGFFPDSIVGSWCSDYYADEYDASSRVNPTGPPSSTVSMHDGTETLVIRRATTTLKSRLMGRESGIDPQKSIVQGLQLVVDFRENPRSFNSSN
jgi:formylglycine-generating enzyme required for sulfatase activity